MLRHVVTAPISHGAAMTERLYLCLDGDTPHGPESSAPPGTVTDLGVHPQLRPYLTQVVAYREQFPDHERIFERVLPDGAVRLIFNLGDTPSVGTNSGASTAVVGASTQVALVHLSGRIEGLSVALRAGTAQSVLGVPAHELEGRAVHLNDVWPTEAPRLMARMAEARDDHARAELLSSLLISRLQGHEDASLTASLAARRVAECGGQVSLHSLAEHVGVGPRRLQQLFRAHVGLSPRAWARLCRMRACLRTLRQGPQPSWARLAVDVGFYDQAHLANEFRSLCGLSPSEFLKRRRLPAEDSARQTAAPER